MIHQDFAKIYSEKSISEVMVHFDIARNTVHYWARKFNLYKIPPKKFVDECRVFSY